LSREGIVGVSKVIAEEAVLSEAVEFAKAMAAALDKVCRRRGSVARQWSGFGGRCLSSD
jgi:hypothetical protein